MSARQWHHDFQAGEGRQDSVIPHRHVRAVRPQGGRTVAAAELKPVVARKLTAENYSRCALENLPGIAPVEPREGRDS